MPEYEAEYEAVSEAEAVPAASARSAESVESAAARAIDHLLYRVYNLREEMDPRRSHEAQIEVQSVMAQLQIMQIAASLPLASIGSCHCGHNLRYRGSQDGLFVCCTGDPEHCWKLG